MTALVTENLPLLTGSPNGVQQIRRLILELAFRGKLTQLTEDSVSAIDSTRNVAPGESIPVAKGSRPAPMEVIEASGPFALPPGWRWVNFGGVAQHNSGKTLDKGRNTGQPRDYITTSNLYWGRFELGNFRQMLIREDELDRCLARKGDLLICEGGEAGRAAVWNFDYEICFQNHIHRARFSDCVNPYFAYRFFERMNATGEINAFRKGVGISNMSSKSLASIPLPLPPIGDQDRIVAKVDELMALCDRLDAEQADADAAHAKLVEALLASLTQARDAADFRASWQQLAEHFHTLFTTEASVDALARAVHDLALRGVLEPQQSAISATLNPGEPIALRSRKSKLPPLTTSEIPFAAPQGWTWQRLEAITSVLTDGEHLTPPRTNDSQQVPLATAKNVRDGFIDLDQTDYVERPVAEKCWKRCKPSRGDVLMVSVGATLGRVAVMADDREMVIVRSVALFRPVQVVPDFLAMALRSGLLQSQIWARVRQSAQPCLYLSQAAQLAVPVPPLEEQQRIVEKVAALLGLCDQLKQRLANARKHHDHLASVLVEQAVA